MSLSSFVSPSLSFTVQSSCPLDVELYEYIHPSCTELISEGQWPLQEPATTVPPWRWLPSHVTASPRTKRPSIDGGIEGQEASRANRPEQRLEAAADDILPLLRVACSVVYFDCDRSSQVDARCDRTAQRCFINLLFIDDEADTCGESNRLQVSVEQQSNCCCHRLVTTRRRHHALRSTHGVPPFGCNLQSHSEYNPRPGIYD